MSIEVAESEHTIELLPNTERSFSEPLPIQENSSVVSSRPRIDPIADTIDAIVDMEQRAERNVNSHQRYVEHGTALIGRPSVLYALVGASALWVLGNLTAEAFHRNPIDAPPFAWLQGAWCIGGLVITMIVLITQNRQARLSERRAQLDLQVNLLNEQKLTKIIELLVQLRRDMPDVINRHDAEAEMMTHGIDTQTMMEAIEVRLEAEELLNEIEAETA